MSCLRSLLILILLLAGGLFGSGSASAQAEAPELQEVRDAAAAYVKALETGDRDSLLAAWTTNGDYVDAAGHSYKGRNFVAENFRHEAQPRPGELRVTVDHLRLVAPKVAIEDGTAQHLQSSRESPVVSRYTAVWVKEDDRWLLDSLRESSLPSKPHNARFSELKWLLGDCVGMTDDESQVLTSGAMSSDGNFLLREFIVTHPDRTTTTVSQRIGWDALANGFRSWTFGADGDYSEGVWKHLGNVWIVYTTGVTADGKQTAATNIYSQISESGYTIESVGALSDGESRPDLKARFERR